LTAKLVDMDIPQLDYRCKLFLLGSESALDEFHLFTHPCDVFVLPSVVPFTWQTLPKHASMLDEDQATLTLPEYPTNEFFTARAAEALGPDSLPGFNVLIKQRTDLM